MLRMWKKSLGFADIIKTIGSKHIQSRNFMYIFIIISILFCNQETNYDFLHLGVH